MNNITRERPSHGITRREAIIGIAKMIALLPLAVETVSCNGPEGKKAGIIGNYIVLDVNGKEVEGKLGKLRDYLDYFGEEKLVFLAFGTNSCHACIRELDDLKTLSEKFAEGLTVIPIFLVPPECSRTNDSCVDETREAIKKTQEIMSERGVKLPWRLMRADDVWALTKSFAETPSVLTLPRHLLIDKKKNGERKIIYYCGGFRSGHEDILGALTKRIEALIKQP